MTSSKGAAVRQDVQEDMQDTNSESDDNRLHDVDSDLDFGDLDELKSEEQPVAVKSMDQVQGEIMDEHDGWLFESTVTDLSAIDLGTAPADGSKEPAWRILERRREEKELREALGDDLLAED